MIMITTMITTISTIMTITRIEAGVRAEQAHCFHSALVRVT